MNDKGEGKRDGKRNEERLKELLLQALEHQQGGVKLYETALKCAVHDELREEWEKYRHETEHHADVLRDLVSQLHLDPEEQTPGRRIVHDLGRSLVAAMEAALGAGDREAAQIIAAECVTLAETKDHLDWELIGEAARALAGAEAKALREAYREVEDEEDEHLYHTKGWTRELWLDALGLRAVLPPPDERKNPETTRPAAGRSRSGPTPPPPGCPT